MKKTILDFQKMAENEEKITFLTAYDYLTAKYQERAGIDMILVGDSLGMVCLGYDKTFPVTRTNDKPQPCRTPRSSEHLHSRRYALYVLSGFR